MGYAVRFNENQVPQHGTSCNWCTWRNLRQDDHVVGASVISDNQEVLVITEKGYGKRTLASEYATKGRGGKGMKTANITEKNGPLGAYGRER